MQHSFDRRSLHAEIVAVYTGTDHESAQIRAAHLSAVARLTPYMMGANIGSGGLVLWSFRGGVPPAIWFWFAALSLISGWALFSWWRNRQRKIETASPRAMKRATAHAWALAAVWAIVPLGWFGQATAAQQTLLATLIAGMLGAGAFVLSPLPLASLGYVCIFAIAGLGAVWQSGDPSFIGVAALMTVYAPMVALGSVTSAYNATTSLRARAESKRQERMLTVLLQDFEQHADEVLWETGADGRLRHFSPRLAGLLGVREADLRDRTLLSLLEGRSASAAALGDALNAGRPFRDLQFAVADGVSIRHVSINGKLIFDDRGNTLGWRGVMADVTEKVLARHRLERQAHTDSLTGLANRLTLRSALADTLELGLSGALLSIDLDHFKAVNDSLGHTVGDELLKIVAQRLSGCMRPGDLVARLGGDEFAVLAAYSDKAENAAALAQRLIDTLQQPIDLHGRRLRIGASVGVAMCDGSGISVDDLLIQVDMALYAAKEAGRGRHVFFVPQLGERSRRRVAIEQGLRQALERGQLSLHWQPRVDIASWQISGVEALMRWEHPELGHVSPGEFIAIAEQAGLIDELGHWALGEACRAATGALAGLTVSVNVSPAQLHGGHFVARVRNALRESGLDPSRLELEITESVFMGDVPDALEHLHSLRNLGVRVALDDFGTGYSSLAYLRRFPFDTLKIDRAFVNEVLLRKDVKAIVQMITQLAVTLGMRTIAEGVETSPQLAAVAQTGCHEVQGYLISVPRPLDEFMKLRRNWRAEPQAMAALH